MTDPTNPASSIRELLRFRPGTALSDIDPHGQPGFDGDKDAGKEALPAMAEELTELQEMMYAAGYTGKAHSILLVLQGMDTAGKGGVVEHTVGLFNPNGMSLKSFKKPTDEELAHDFLWRIEKALPGPGMVGVFDRSHYEDVLVVKVHELADPAEIERRYDAINDFEKKLADEGTIIIKCMLHISKEEQRQRLLARLDEPHKNWKFKPGDVDERQHWDDYQAAYQVALDRCSTDVAPWYVVPSDRKWYRNWAIGQMLLESLREMDLSWPQADYDVAEQRARLEKE